MTARVVVWLVASLSLSLSSAILSVLGPASASARGSAGEIDLTPPPGLRSRSVAFPWAGRLQRGMRLHESQYIRYVGEYAAGGNFFGTWELVQLLERAARRVAFRLPGARLAVGELSSGGGGPLSGHRSHQSGRDVDIAFYVTLPDGTPTRTFAFADFDAHGRGVPPNQYLRFDDARNWELVAKLVADGDARVQFIFVSDALKYRLLREGERRAAPPSVIERARAVMAQPHHGHPHKNHFHVRIYCARADRPRCQDRSPFWPWYAGTPPGGEFTSPGHPLRIYAP